MFWEKYNELYNNKKKIKYNYIYDLVNNSYGWYVILSFKLYSKSIRFCYKFFFCFSLKFLLWSFVTFHDYEICRWNEIKILLNLDPFKILLERPFAFYILQPRSFVLAGLLVLVFYFSMIEYFFLFLLFIFLINVNFESWGMGTWSGSGFPFFFSLRISNF